MTPIALAARTVELVPIEQLCPDIRTRVVHQRRTAEERMDHQLRLARGDPKARKPVAAGPSTVLFDWYARVRGEFRTIERGDLLASWQCEMWPVLWPIGDALSDAEIAATPNQYVRDASGLVFAYIPLAQPEPALDRVTVVTLDAAGIAVVTADQATHDRELALRLLPDGDDPAVRALRRLAEERLPSGRRDGLSARTGRPWRKGHDPAVIARALVAFGLKELGETHRSAIGQWLRGEHDLGGEYGDAHALEALARGYRAMWRPFEDRVAATNRRVWNELGLNLYPKVDPGLPHAFGHGPHPPSHSQRKP